MDLFEGRQKLKTPPILVGLCLVSAAMMLAAIWMIFFYAPIEATMGFVQKIFYFHVPSAWVMFLATGVCAFGSIAYLIKKTDRWDRTSDAGVELAIIFGIIVLITGPLWGRKAWGAYWVWDVRLTSSLILVLTLIACKIARSYAGTASRELASGLAVFAVINSIFVYYSVNLWRGTHPPKLVAKGQLAPEMSNTLWFCVLTFCLTFVCLFWIRLRHGLLKNGLERLELRAKDAGITE